jgi:O-antigen/teichoic acid export membrane protein
MQSLSDKVKSGAIWILCGRIIDRGLGFVKIPVLSYLLSPRDFGLMGIISAVIMYMDVLTRTGFDRALVQKKDITDYLDTGWTLNAMKGLVQTLMLIVLIKPIISFYEEPLLGALLIAVSLILILQNLRSIRLIHLERNLDMKQLTIYESGSTVFSTIVTIIFAYYLRNVWSLVVGQIALAVYALVVSYLYAPYRPRIDFNPKKIGELWGFGKWLFLTGIIMATINQMDNLFIGKVLSVSALGYYTMAYNLGRILPNELTDRLRRIFFPAFSSIQDDIPRLRTAFLKTHIFNTLIGGLVSMELFFLSEEFVTIFLADKWIPIIPTLRIFAVWSFFQIILSSFAPLYLSVGHPEWWAKVQSIRLVLMGMTIYPLTIKTGITGTAISVLISTGCLLPLCLYLSKKAIRCSWRDILAPIILLSITVFFISGMTGFLNNAMTGFSVWMNFLLTGFLICCAYWGLVWIIDSKMKTGVADIYRQLFACS